MTGYTFVEKALARAAGVESACVGDILDVRPHLVFSHDNTAAIRGIFLETGAPRILHPDRVAITLDHAVPHPRTESCRDSRLGEGAGNRALLRGGARHLPSGDQRGSLDPAG